MSVRQWWRALWVLVIALGLYDVCILLATGVKASASAEIVYYATVISGALITLLALLVRRNEKPNAFDLALMMLAATLASPIAWEHHFAFLLGVFAMLAPRMLAEKPMGRWSMAYLAAAFCVASRRLEFTDHLAETPFNFLQSYLFFAALMTMVILYVVLLHGSLTRRAGEMLPLYSASSPPSRS